MITSLELCLNHLGDAELAERVDVLTSLVEDGFALLAGDESGHTILVPLPPPELPMLWPPGLA